MPTFTPPAGPDDKVPTVLPSTPEWQRLPSAYFQPEIDRPPNVWVWSDGTVSDTQPPFWDYDANNPSIPYVVHFYQGGASHEVSADEAATLTAAGYGGSIT